MNKTLSITIASGLLMSSVATFAAQDAATAETVTPTEATTQPGLTAINPANPAFIMGLMNPSTHQAAHGVLRNPANWMQFMQPQFYMQMANPANAMAWMNPGVYQSMMNPAAMMQWMQPATIMNEVSSVPVATLANPATYMTFMNPAIAQSWMNPATFGAAATQMFPGANEPCGTDPSASAACGANPAASMFDMSAWTNMFQPVIPEAKQAEEAKEQG